MRISDWSSDVCSSDLSHRFLRISAAPAILTHQPANFVIARILRQRIVDPLDPAMADHLAAGLFDHEQEAETLLRIERLRPGVLGLDLVEFLDPAEPGHDRRRIEQSVLFGRIARSEENTSELQSIMRISFAVF